MVTTKVTTLHLDGLGSVRAVTDRAGAVVERTTYRPYGEEVPLAQPLTLPETRGFIGERFDAGAGLQYLNARYYDPRLGMFLQPDWWEVTQKGVGTNRYSYSFNDPVNGKDPSGHLCVPCGIAIGAVVGYFSSADPANAPTEDSVVLAANGDLGLIAGAAAPALTVAGLEVAGSLAYSTTAARAGLFVADAALSEYAGVGVAGTIAVNAANGKLGEKIAGSWLAEKGYEIVGKQVTVATQQGKRVVDYLVRDKFGKLFTVEVKTGAAKVKVAQAAKDAEIASSGGRIVGKNGGDYSNSDQVMDAMDVRVDAGSGCVSSCSMRNGGSVPKGKGLLDRLKDWLGL